MIKGAHRRMVVLKNTGSPLFEEAYFILREGKTREDRHRDLVSEANRIVAASTGSPMPHSGRQGLRCLLWLLIGALGGGGVTVLLLLLL